MKIKFYKNCLIYICTVFFLYSCDSSSTSSYNVDDGDNNMGGGSDNTELPGGFSKFISEYTDVYICLLYTSPSPRDRSLSRMPSSA